MYFDFDYYWKVLKHVASLKGWKGRNKTLFKLLILVPLESAIHSIFFLLDYVFFPSLWTQKVVQPIFVLGHARSGTTLTHRLLSADGDRFNDFLYWEMFFPSLLEKKIIRFLGKIDQDWFGGPIKKRLVKLDDQIFGPYRHMHYMSLWASEEDQFSMRASFVSQQWSLEVPMMDVIDMFHVDKMPAKRKRWLHHYKEIVKRQILLNGGDKTHLSKNPVMCGWVDSIIETFPDAKILVMMRNPLECIPSVLKLVEVSWKGKKWNKDDYAASLNILTDISFETFIHPKKILAQHSNVPQMVVDYRKITTEPRETVLNIYKALGLDVSESYDQYLQQQEEKERGHKTRFEYSIDDYDQLSAERIEKELDDFFDDHQWPKTTEAVEPYEDAASDG